MVFGEEMARDMRNTFVLGLGVEYAFLSEVEGLFFRLGFRFDPQPVRSPNAMVFAITTGIGVRFSKALFDVAISQRTANVYGNLQEHTILSGTLRVHLGGEY
jgi:hypothetical protein